MIIFDGHEHVEAPSTMTTDEHPDLKADVQIKEILRKIVANGCEAWSEMGYVYCYFCGGILEGDHAHHKDDCVYEAARKFLE